MCWYGECLCDGVVSAYDECTCDGVIYSTVPERNTTNM